MKHNKDVVVSLIKNNLRSFRAYPREFFGHFIGAYIHRILKDDHHDLRDSSQDEDF